MKITKLKSEKRITAEDVKPGFVFEYLDTKGIMGSCNVTALKLEQNKIVLLQYSNGDDWFVLKDLGSCWKNNSVKILGKVEEIIVNPNIQGE
ncbi:MAG: hypothetical protein A7316_10225 [Candidatus Altiarchaeales archaeon WOR_SM1_86-2]|nr:MAG: hypothetical protein A7316_10225 [Candidatus Altiarchaeales archaeon WOR_SM1_86-2]